ncbi:unnamed protein product [Ilex paraguariensis]|uniref:Uncharacterized protein n=1 Tax=Ilex paraguariensis TaxID=185542 RepID=A0ABC8UPE9_9AQUA
MMDFKFIGKTWVGNIYQKFEAMCHEVDDFVSQESVKYAENQGLDSAKCVEKQEQTVGESVKRFCSDVVEGLHPPPLVDPVTQNVQEEPEKQKDSIGTCNRSMISIEEKPVGIDVNKSSGEQDPIEPLENHHSSPCTILGPVKLIPCHTAGSARAAVSELSMEQEDDSLVNKNADVVSGENVVEEEQSSCGELSSPEDKDLSDASSSSESVDESHKNELFMKVSPAMSVHGAGLSSSQRNATICNSFSEVGCVSNVSTNLQSSEMGLSVIACEKKVVESALASSSFSLSLESCNLSEFSHSTFCSESEKICNNPIDGSGSVSDVSSALSSSESFPTIAFGRKVVDLGLAFSGSILSLESNAGSSGIKDDMCCSCIQLEAYMSSLEIGQADDPSIDLNDPSMETIDLSEKMSLGESCVIVDSQLPYAVSCRARKHRSYKKIIQDAFASRKRLSKEFEQFGIWYGDIDIESSQQAPQNLLSSIPISSFEPKKPATHDLCDSEWELL